MLRENQEVPQFTAQQKTEIVLASLRGPKTMAELCREHDIVDGLLRNWREQFLAAGAERFSGKTEAMSCAVRSVALGARRWRSRSRGELLRGWE